MKNRILTFAILLLAWLATNSQLRAQQPAPADSSQRNNEYQVLMEKIS